MRGRICALVLGSLLLAGCGSSAETTATAGADGFVLTYQRTGGVASTPSGVLVVRGSGEATVGGASVEMSSAEFEALQTDLQKADIEKLPEHMPTGCSDCYVYTITVNGRRVSFDESNLPSRLQPLVDDLEAISPSG
jgi:hypothetical protein